MPQPWYMYLIDGVQVPIYIFYRRRLFGEHDGAKFECISIQPKIDPRKAFR